MENSKVVDVPEWEHFLIFRNVMYTTAFPSGVHTDHDVEHLIKLLIAGDVVAGHVASPTEQAYTI